MSGSKSRTKFQLTTLLCIVATAMAACSGSSIPEARGGSSIPRGTLGNGHSTIPTPVSVTTTIPPVAHNSGVGSGQIGPFTISDPTWQLQWDFSCNPTIGTFSFNIVGVNGSVPPAGSSLSRSALVLNGAEHYSGSGTFYINIHTGSQCDWFIYVFEPG